MLKSGWILAALACGGVSWLLLRSSRSGFRWLPCLAFLVVCGLGVWELRAPDAALPARWVVLDVSGSCAGGRSQWRRWCEHAAADLPPEGQIGLIRAGATAEVALPLSDPQSFRAGLSQALSAPLEANGSAVGLALRLAAQTSPGLDVVLISDGRASDDLDAGARAVSAQGGRVFCFGPELPAPQGAWIDAFEAPAEVAPGARAQLRISVGAWRPTACELVLSARGNPARVLQRWTLKPGPQSEVVVWETPPLTAATELQARLAVRGVDDPSDNRRRARVGLAGKPSALVVGAELRLPGCDVRRADPAELAAALREPPAAILLADVDARSLTPAVGALRRAIEGGSALVVLGARRAFGQGGYAGSELEALLPVTSGPGTERSEPLSAAFVIDASGSMLGGGHYRAAVEALPWSALRADDPVLALAFAEQVTPQGDWSTDHAALGKTLRAYAQRAPGGGTDVGAALLAGLERLAPRDGTRVLIAVTDSLDPNPERHLPALRALELDPEHWSVLLVRIGAEDDAALRSFAAALGPAARVLAVDAADAALRDALAGELAASRASLREGSFALAPTPEGAQAGLAAAQVRGYAAVRARPAARVLALAADAELDNPPLACSWQVGSGSVLALPLTPADASAPLSQLLGDLLPASSDLTLTARRQPTGLAVHARGDRVADAHLELVVEGSPPTRWPLPAGDAELTLPAPDGPCEVRVRAAEATLARASVPPVREAARAGVDARALGSLCARHGGRLLATLPTELPPRVDARERSLAALLALLAALALLADVGWGVLTTRRAIRGLVGVELA